MSETQKPLDQYHHGDLGRAAAETAYALARARGAAAVSLRDVAGALSVTHRALYRHYTDRSALLASAAAIGFTALADSVSRASTRKGFCRAYIRFARAEHHVYALIMTRFEKRPASLDAAIRRLTSAAADVLGGEEPAKRAWLALHGGLSLGAAGMLATRSESALEAFLIQMALG